MRQMLQKVVYSSTSDSSIAEYFLKTVRDLTVYRFAIGNFVANNLRMRYRRSVLGILWTLLNPLLTMSTMAVAFSIIFDVEIRKFCIYLFSGLLPWGMISGAAVIGSSSIINAEGWFKKVYVPKMMFPLIAIVTELVNFFLGLASLFIIVAIASFPVSATLLYLPLNILILFVFCLGLAVLAGVVSTYFRDMINIVQVVFSALFYATPVIYYIDRMPAWVRPLLGLNPCYQFVKLFQDTIYYSAAPQPGEFAAAGTTAALTLSLAFFVLMKTEKYLVFRL